MQHDVIDDQYGRLYEIPENLSGLGYCINGHALSYKLYAIHDEANCISEAGVRWHSVGTGALILPSLIRHYFSLLKTCRDERPDFIMASSDCLHIALGGMLSKHSGIPLIADLYDNYASFGLCKFPFLGRLYKRALARAQMIATVSETLKEYVQNIVPGCHAITIESTIDARKFKPMPVEVARGSLDLPQDRLLIGATGALDESRNINVVYDAASMLLEANEHCELLLAGVTGESCPVPEHPRIRYLGQLPHDSMPAFYNAMDISILPMKDSEFGRYAFPQKAYEILSCNTTPLFANVGDMNELLSGYAYCLYQHDSAEDLCNKISCQLERPRRPDIGVPEWKDQAVKLNNELNAVFCS